MNYLLSEHRVILEFNAEPEQMKELTMRQQERDLMIQLIDEARKGDKSLRRTMVRCPYCGQSVKQMNLERHARAMHPKCLKVTA